MINKKSKGAGKMETFIFFLLLLGYLILLIYGMKFATNAGWFVVENVILLVILALTYEQAVLSFGKYIDEGVLLKNLNAARFGCMQCLHHCSFFFLGMH